MMMIRSSVKAAVLMMGLVLLGSAMAPSASAAAVICQNRNGHVSCWIQW
jgi:hypothetical protein